MATKEFKLPDIGEGIAEGEIVNWMVEVGQTVKEEDPFVEVMTDKATVTITVPYDGVIQELRAKAGDIVPVESVIAVIDTSGGGAAPAAASKPEAKQPAAAASAPPPAPQAKAPAASVPAAPPAHGNGNASRAPAAFVQASPGKVLAAPATRRRARELGIDLHAVPGTGPSGRVTNDDLKRFGTGSPSAAPAAAAKSAAAGRAFTPQAIASLGNETRTPFVGLRRKIAEAMTRSKYTATHFTYVDDIDVTELVALRKQAKALFADQGVNITYLPFIMKAAVAAMKQFPTMNASLDEVSNELVVKHYYNFGIATDTDNGLIVPVVRDVDRKSIPQLAFDIQELARKSREGKLMVDDLQGGTFTLTNAGNIGGLFATPVINFPEVSIMGVHKIKKTPVVNAAGQIVVGDVMYLSVSIDHRIVDGATGARWMNVVKDLLEQPQKLLLGSL
ncbi:MAG: 2-oxo acid dehydrogenase subunit E2 [Planctomycetes bacterium]|nr:2-oxo acid dehydrogenase subunit E2 [Planctomycetota bacterium]MCB9871429.1 2-oxo acid dehydrogenase subunit E2 [Planctomycetota bacterium]MCB9888721.1 2-oxo acid dehydrogenase subunit E2 [Planctomycetota bacterium]